MNTQKPYRRTVEIYFVLYLAALLLLLPDEQDSQTAQDRPDLVSALLATNFSIVPEKNYLTARLQRTDDGTTVLSIDSTNTISAVGNVRDVRYEFFIEDRSLGETLRLTADAPSSTRVFTLLQDPVGESATFVWRPLDSERSGRTFTVRVVAHAKPVVPPALRSNESLRRQLEQIIADEGTALTARTQFEVAVSVVGSGMYAAGGEGPGRVDTVVTMTALPPDTRQPVIVTPGGDPVFDLEYKHIDAIAGQQWTNEARLYNLDLKGGLQEAPRVVFPAGSNNGTASIERIDVNNNTIHLRGTAPLSGAMRVQLIAVRAADTRQVVTEFVVRPAPMAPPSIPSTMYPDRQYMFDPELPILTGQTVSAVLYDGDDERFVSRQGEQFFFTPRESDIGRVLRFERFINGKKVGESYPVEVLNYPPPRVVSVYDEPGRIIVKTQGFGPEADIGKRIKLDVTDRENCREPREVYGDYTYDRKTGAHIQVFELTKIEKDKPASCTVVAVDQKRRRSEPHSFGK